MYLYDQQKELLELDRKGGCNVPFHATERDLSKRWGWHRNTVSSFLDKLQELGILDHQKSSTGLRILMKVEWVEPWFCSHFDDRIVLPLLKKSYNSREKSCAKRPRINHISWPFFYCLSQEKQHEKKRKPHPFYSLFFSLEAVISSIKPSHAAQNLPFSDGIMS